MGRLAQESPLAPLTESRRDLVLALDGSASTGYRDAVQSTFEIQVERAREILGELGRDVAASGGRFVVVDTMEYFESRTAEQSADLERYCAANGFGHVRLSTPLMAARERGEGEVFAIDGHFTELGNRLFAEAMLAWLRANPREREQGRSDQDAASADGGSM